LAFQLTPEEELEKQYRDYKAEFEKWKENNKNAVGTEPYMAYVEKFEAWEREVENRREEIRAKAQEAQETQKAEAQAAAEAKRKKELEAEEEKKKQQEAEAAAQAAAYAQHQQSYLAHHQAAIQKEQLMRQQQEVTALQNVDTSTETLDKSRMADVMQQMEQMAQMVMSGQNAESFEADGIYQQQIAQPAPQPAQQIIGPPPQLWGNDRVIFDSSDPMYKRWGLRAAPPYHKPPYKPPPPNYQPLPCWLFVEQMKDEKLILPSLVNVPPPSIIPSFTARGH
uniref:TolA protein n=1 Tax=Syphacia muris TaxID=451379 RepID=A0A0N5AVP6_9BILA